MTAAEFVNALKNPREHTIVETANGPIIRFDGATLHDCHVFEEIEINYGVVFQGVTFGNFTLQKLKANGFVRFKNCNSYENTIFNVSIETPFDIIIDQNFLFEGRVEFRNCTCNSFKMFGGEFNGGINFLSNSFNIFYFTGNSKIKNDIIFTSNTVGRFSLNGGKIENIKFGSGNTQILSFSKDIEINNCQIRGGRFKTIAFNTSNVRNINNNLLFEPDLEPLIIEILDINNIKNGFLGLSEICNIGEIQFNYGFISKDTIVDISKITVNSLTFYNFINYGQINFKSFTCREQLHFIDSDIGKVTFIGCDFQNALIDFKSSKIIEAFIIGGKFPEKFINKENLDKQGAYSQIKKIYENRGSQKDALEYYSLEMNALDESLPWKSNRWEKINLCLNKFSTNHGVDWKQGLKSTFYVSAGFFFLYIVSLWSYTPNLLKLEYWCEFFNVLSQYFDFINPAHKTDIVAEKLSVEPNPVSRTIEGLSRIFIAYFIYQLIQAFRKHGKK